MRGIGGHTPPAGAQRAPAGLDWATNVMPQVRKWQTSEGRDLISTEVAREIAWCFHTPGCKTFANRGEITERVAEEISQIRAVWQAAADTQGPNVSALAWAIETHTALAALHDYVTRASVS